MEYLLKNGPPRVQQELRNDSFKFSQLQSFSYYEDNSDKGLAIRDKAILIQDLITSPQRLEVEREQARVYREKFNIGSRGGGGYDQYDRPPTSMSSVSSQSYGSSF